MSVCQYAGIPVKTGRVIMTRIITLANQKGGCAKTTTAVNLSAGLANRGKKTLLIDMDSQANATAVFIDNPDKLKNAIYDVLINNTPLKEVIISTKVKNLDIVPSNIMLSAADIKLANVLGRERLLKKRIKGLIYDYIIIDTPPSLGLLTVNSLTAANEVIIPISMSYFALKGVKLLEETIENVKENLDHPELKISGVLATYFDPVTNVSKDALRMIKDYFGDLVFKTIIRKNIKLEEAHSSGVPIFDYEPRCIGAEDYNNLVEEVLNL
jgi:chromosome partitioning protein